MDKRLVLTSENSILNDPNASIADIRELLEYKKTLNHISDEYNDIDSIIGTMREYLDDRRYKYTLVSIILSFDERFDRVGVLYNHMYYYTFSYRYVDTCVFKNSSIIVPYYEGIYMYHTYDNGRVMKSLGILSRLMEAFLGHYSLLSQ